MRLALVLLVCILAALPGFGQGSAPHLATGPVSVVPVSPNAASLGRFVEAPVGLYTGIPVTNIPLWQLTQGNSTTGVSLNYHGGGSKVEEVCSWLAGGLSGGERSLPARYEQDLSTGKPCF